MQIKLIDKMYFTQFFQVPSTEHKLSLWRLTWPPPLQGQLHSCKSTQHRCVEGLTLSCGGTYVMDETLRNALKQLFVRCNESQVHGSMFE